MSTARRDIGVPTCPNFEKTQSQTGLLGTRWDICMSQLSRSYGALIVIITNIIDYYYSCDRRDSIFINLLLLAIGGSIAGILGIFVYIHVPSVPSVTFTPLSEIYTMILDSIPPQTGVIT